MNHVTTRRRVCRTFNIQRLWARLQCPKMQFGWVDHVVLSCMFLREHFHFPLAFDPLRVAVAAVAAFSILERFSRDNMAAAAGHYYGDGGRATKRQKTENDGMATVISPY